MIQVDVLEAKNDFFALVRAIENGEVDGVVITRLDKPVARLIPYASDATTSSESAKD